MVCMENENIVHRSRQNRVHLVIFARNRKTHLQEIGRVIEIVSRINKWLANRILVGHGGNRRQLCNHTDRRNIPLDGIVDVCRVVIKSGEGADDPHEDSHRVGIAPEPGEETVHLLVNHRVHGYTLRKILELRLRWQFTVKQQMAGFEEVSIFRELVDRVAAVKQDSFLAIDICDLGLATGSESEPRVKSETPRLTVMPCYVDDIRTNTALINRQILLFAIKCQSRGFLVVTY